jgi:hypothetical protein
VKVTPSTPTKILTPSFHTNLNFINKWIEQCPFAYKDVLLKIHVFYTLSIVTNVIELDDQMYMLIFVHFASLSKVGMFEMTLMTCFFSQNEHYHLHLAFLCLHGIGACRYID